MKKTITLRLPEKSMRRLCLLGAVHERTRTEVIVAAIRNFYAESFESLEFPGVEEEKRLLAREAERLYRLALERRELRGLRSQERLRSFLAEKYRRPRGVPAVTTRVIGSRVEGG